MRSLRILRQMAGVQPTQFEKHLARQTRRMQRIERQANVEMMLVSMIQAREQGADGAKPMPFANLNPSTEGHSDVENSK